MFGDKCLLGRQRPWPRGMHSALAGFIEPGEAIEEAVARETLEEAGLNVREVRAALDATLAVPAFADDRRARRVRSDAEKIDTAELESGRWFTREEARQLIAAKHPDASARRPSRSRISF